MDKGTYIILSEATTPFQCRIGKLGELKGAKGYYLYVGSAQGSGGLKARVRHHLRISSKPHWHFDYIRPYLSLKWIWFAESRIRYEHQWALALENLPASRCVLEKFGATDCNCKSHFYYFKNPPDIAAFKKTLTRLQFNSTGLSRKVVEEWEN